MTRSEARAKFGRDSLKSLLSMKFPKVARCEKATRTIRSDGRADRYVFLYEGKNHDAKIIGKCDYRTICAFAAAGMFQYQSPMYSTSDTAEESWWKKEFD